LSHVALRVEAASVGGLFILEMSAFDPKRTLRRNFTFYPKLTATIAL
jgi:hypothetical protein